MLKRKPTLTADATTTAETYFARVETPIGKLLLVGTSQGTGLALRGFYFDGAPHGSGAVPAAAREVPDAFADVKAQLAAYFEGRRSSFDLAARAGRHGIPTSRLDGTHRDSLRHDHHLCGDRPLDRQTASRARRGRRQREESAFDRRPLPSRDRPGRDLTGYAGGLPSKRRLLELESAHHVRPLAR